MCTVEYEQAAAQPTGSELSGSTYACWLASMHSACWTPGRGLAPKTPGSAHCSRKSLCALAQRGEPSPTTGWQGLPAFNHAVQGMPLVMQPDALTPGSRSRGEVRQH